MFSIGVLGLVYAIGHQIGAHPIAFILYAMVVSALMLLAVTGPGPEAMRIIMAPQSWLVGIATVGLEIFYYLTLTHIAPTTGSLLVRIAIPLAMVVGWVLFSRRPPRLAMIGGVIVIVGMVPLSFHGAGRAPGRGVLGRTRAAALAFILRSFSSEFHPWNRRAKTVMEKLRITGLVVLVTCIIGLALAAPAAGRSARRAAAAARHPHGRADAARAHYPARHAGRQRRRSPRSWCSASPPWSRSAPRISRPPAPSRP